LKRLKDHERFEIAELAKSQRRIHELGMGPLGDNIFKLLRTLNIQLVRYPIPASSANPNPFSALYVASNEDGHTMRYIGLNTDDYYDKQIFLSLMNCFTMLKKCPRWLCAGLKMIRTNFGKRGRICLRPSFCFLPKV